MGYSEQPETSWTVGSQETGDLCEIKEMKTVLRSMNTARSQKLLTDFSLQPTKLMMQNNHQEKTLADSSVQSLSRILLSSPKPVNL